ncbi:MAG TPA: FkbM family methyltransferase [Thermoplasmata archaeon]|nr:FkbM family methyltransferase [Thermoplasmata archaeon]
MGLPGRAYRHFRELHRRGLVAATLGSVCDDAAAWGVGGHIRYAMELAGVENFMAVRYPTGSRFRVRVSPFWKYWKGLEAGTEDRENLAFLASFVKPGQTVLDVGAWEGPYALLFGECVGPTGHVYAFEPDPSARTSLEANIAANRLANVTAEPRCLSDREGSASFYDAHGGTIGSLVRNDLVAGLSRVPIRTTTVDSFCREKGIRVDGLKVDVEGAEGLVLAGAEELIRRDSPWLFLEFHGVLMPEDEKRRSWSTIMGAAHQITFVHGKSQRYKPGDSLDAYPDCDYFHVLVRY